MVDGIILAGGFSSRCGSNKMVFDFNGKPMIWHTINSMRPFVNRIIVVTGRYDQETRDILKDEKDIEFAFNENFESGMFSSVKKGVEKVNNDFFIIPGDCPFVASTTFEAILKGTGMVRYPVCNGREGHPIFIKHELKEALLNEGKDSNLRIFRDKQDVEKVSVDDPCIVNDIDTYEDYLKIINERK